MKRNFNLLKPLNPPPTVWDKVYLWFIDKARIVILIAELIIAFAFILKVIEDTNAKNKDKEIEQLRNELSFYGFEMEPTFRNIQNKSDRYILIWNNSSKFSDSLSEIVSYLPSNISEISIRFGDNEVGVYGYEDLNSIRDLENALKTSSNFSNTKVTDLTLGQGDVIQSKGRYSLTADINDYNRNQL